MFKYQILSITNYLQTIQMLKNCFSISIKKRKRILNWPLWCVSISTGLVIIINEKYYLPMFEDVKGQYSIFSVLFSIFAMSVFKIITIGILKYLNKDPQRPEKMFVLGYQKLMIPTIIKVVTYLSFLVLLCTIEYLTTSIIFGICFFFLLWYNDKSKKSTSRQRKQKRLANKIFDYLSYILVLIFLWLNVGIIGFRFQNHVELFLIGMSTMLIISFFYFGKLITNLTDQFEDQQDILFRQYVIQAVIYLMIIAYAFFFQECLTLEAQLNHMYSHLLLFFLIAAINLFYEIFIRLFLSKIEFIRLFQLMLTGFLWYNMLSMIKNDQNELRNYLSVVIIFFILFFNTEICSEYCFNSFIKRVDLLLKGGNKKRRKELNEQTELN